jgi:4-diphosphocytidyl-2-C-methyl-D-erythritol kinase
MTSAAAYAKINLGLVVGPLRADGRHEIATLLQRIDLHDTVSLEASDAPAVAGFAPDTLVRGALEAVAAAAGVEPSWAARIEKRIPVAAGLGGGSSDAAAALLLANALLPSPLPSKRLHALARGLGSDVPFFLEPGPKLATGDGTELAPVELPQDYSVVLLLPRGEEKPSTASVYARFSGEDGFAERRARLIAGAAGGRQADLAALPGNDLATSPHGERLVELGAFRAEVSGAGPCLYGLFAEREQAKAASEALGGLGETYLATPAW